MHASAADMTILPVRANGVADERQKSATRKQTGITPTGSGAALCLVVAGQLARIIER